MRKIYPVASTRHFFTAGLVILLFLLAACGTNANTTTTGSNSNNPATTPTTPALQHCGIIHAMRMLVVPADESNAKKVEDCFWQAYQHCNPATMVYSQGGVDTATIHTFSLKSQNGGCVVTDALQHQVVPRPAQSAGNHVCSGLQQQTDGLHFLSCAGEGDVVVPGSQG
ncbi:MAG TPA: hypothetical protein VF458_05060 [Ktedonobacteraceae bacterium]